MTLLGGMGTVFGPLVGAAVIVTMQNYLADLRRLGDGDPGRDLRPRRAALPRGHRRRPLALAEAAALTGSRQARNARRKMPSRPSGNARPSVEQCRTARRATGSASCSDARGAWCCRSRTVSLRVAGAPTASWGQLSAIVSPLTALLSRRPDEADRRQREGKAAPSPARLRALSDDRTGAAATRRVRVRGLDPSAPNLSGGPIIPVCQAPRPAPPPPPAPTAPAARRRSRPPRAGSPAGADLPSCAQLR